MSDLLLNGDFVEVEPDVSDPAAARMPTELVGWRLHRTYETCQDATGPRMSDRLAAIRYFREQVGGEIPIMGWVEGALAEAADPEARRRRSCAQR